MPVKHLQELDSAGVRAVARGLPQLGLPATWSSAFSGNIARTLRAETARSQLVQPVLERLTVYKSRHDRTEVQQEVAFVPPASLAAKLWTTDQRLLFGESKAERETFWTNFQRFCPTHPLFLDLEVDLSMCFPIALHGDEGAGLDKAAALSCARFLRAFCVVDCAAWSAAWASFDMARGSAFDA